MWFPLEGKKSFTFFVSSQIINSNQTCLYANMYTCWKPSICVCMRVWVVLEHRPVLQCMCYKNWKQLNGKVQIRCQSCTVLGESVLLERCLQSHKLCDKTPSSAKPPKQTINHTRDAGRIYFQKHDSQTDSRKERKPYSLPIHSLAS